MIRIALAFSTSLLILAACDLDVFAGGEPGSDALSVHGLDVQLTLDRAEVAPGGTFTAMLSVENTGAETVTLESLCAALTRGVVYRDGEKVGLRGSGSGCRPAVSTYNIAPGDTLEQGWEVRAETIVRSYPDGRPPETEPAEPGEYLFRAEPDVWKIDEEEATLPEVERQFTIR